MTLTQTKTKVKKLVLKLVNRKKKVSFTSDTVDNEHLQKKKSKICCIFHSKNECKDKNKFERG
jgi:protein phosphatase 1 regulatory subunit 11